MGWYLRCHSLNLWPTKIRACPTPIPSSRSLSYSSAKAAEVGCPRSICRASSSLVGVGTSSTLMVFGLYQCIKLLLSRTRSRPSPKPRGVRLHLVGHKRYTYHAIGRRTSILSWPSHVPAPPVWL